MKVKEPLTGWQLRLSQVVEITALFLIAGGLLRNVAEVVTDGALKGFPFVTLGSLMVFIASHRLSGRSFLPRKGSESVAVKQSSGGWTLPSIGALFFTGVTQKLYGFGGFLGGVALFAGFLLVLVGVQWLVHRLLKKSFGEKNTEPTVNELSRAPREQKAHGAPVTASRNRVQTSSESPCPPPSQKIGITVDAISLSNWEKALDEFDGPHRDRGLWAKVFADANGDESKAKAAYLKAAAERFNTTHNTEAAPSAPMPSTKSASQSHSEQSSNHGAVDQVRSTLQLQPEQQVQTLNPRYCLTYRIQENRDLVQAQYALLPQSLRESLGLAASNPESKANSTMTEPTDHELVEMAAASPHRDLIRQVIRSGEQGESDSPPVPNSERMEQQDEPDGRVSLLSKEVSEHRKWLEEQEIHLSPCYWIRNEPQPSESSTSQEKQPDLRKLLTGSPRDSDTEYEDEPTFTCLTQRLDRVLAQSTKSDESPKPHSDLRPTS